MNGNFIRRTTRLLSVAAAVAALSPPAGAGEWKVNGGTLRVGGTIRADWVRIEAGGTLAGYGYVDANVNLAGAVAPGQTDGAVASLGIGGRLDCRGGVFVCDVTGASPVADRLEVRGVVSGVCDVLVQQGSGCVPWRTEIVAGATGSDYYWFGISPAGSQKCQLITSTTHLLLTDVVTDSDGDGMTDSWEHTYFGHPTDAAPGVDSDGDRLTNLQEFLAGTVPTNASSALRFVQAAPLGGYGFVVTWDSVAGRFYDVMRWTPSAGDYLPIRTHVPALPPQNTYTDDTSAAAHAFYRIDLSD